jgi:Zn finger protein HypA/HybF involved in hydrogenase expression
VERLEELVAQGLTVREIAAELGISTSTVRERMAARGLVTARAQRTAQFRAAAEMGLSKVESWCPKHGQTDFFRISQARFRCGRCNSAAVARRRRKVKQTLVADAGGSCSICGYSRCTAALQFHHLRPAEKSFGLGWRGVSRSIADARAEAAKCALLCANCHAEVEAGVTSIPEPPAATVGPEFGPG